MNIAIQNCIVTYLVIFQGEKSNSYISAQHDSVLLDYDWIKEQMLYDFTGP